MPQALRHEFLLTPLREGRPASIPAHIPAVIVFLLTPLREGRQYFSSHYFIFLLFLLTPLREGQLPHDGIVSRASFISTHAPAGGATRSAGWRLCPAPISTHAPAGGATSGRKIGSLHAIFLLTPLREGRPRAGKSVRCMPYFYSRPCGRGDVIYARYSSAGQNISTHAPAGGATLFRGRCAASRTGFLLTPLREGRRTAPSLCSSPPLYFYSRPCGRGDFGSLIAFPATGTFLLTPLREGRRMIAIIVPE